MKLVKKNRMKSIFRLFIFFLAIITVTACQTIEVGIEPTSTVEPSSTPTQPAESLSTPTLKSPPISTTTTPASENAELVTYTQSAYGFSFTYPSTWEIKQDKNFIELVNNAVTLQMGFKKEGEGLQISLNPLPTTTLIQDKEINFLTQTITRNTWLEGDKVRAVYYNRGNDIKVGSMVFSFLLAADKPTEVTGIPVEIQDQADQIIASFEATFELANKLCTDKADFIQDVTVLDDTRFSPGEKFTKTWRLANAGSCTWSTSYSLIFVSGDPMSGQSPQPLTAEITPGQTADFSINLTAPASAGTYRGNWMLQNEKGDLFGLGFEANNSFWVQITVGETAPDIRQTLGEPSFTDTLASTNNWFLLDTANTKFSAGNNNLTLTALNTGQTEEWGIANVSPLKDFYLEIKFTTTEKCVGLDRYGVIVRAPDPNQGYIYGFSCDGRYRLYKWDGKKYQALQEWKNSPNINAGPDQTNRLGIYLIGDNLKLYANGKLLSEYTDDTFSEGRFGVFVGAEETKNFTVLMEEAAYWKFK